jgi:RNA polymerase sigma-70 factor (ECF subfamily)
MVVAAGDTRNPDSREALADLCQTYWYPVYAHIRHAGHAAADAEDLTQGFFLHLLEKHALKVASQERGRFRAFLKASIRNFLANERTWLRAQKRGGGKKPIRLDAAEAESQYRLEPAAPHAPDTIFEQRWARIVLAKALNSLRGEMRTAGAEERFNRLEPFLTGNPPEKNQAQVAAGLGMSESAVRVAVHRMRRRFGELLRREVSQTLHDATDADDEIRYLFSVIDT